MDSYAEEERLSWNMPLFGAIMIMPNYKFVEVIMPLSISESPYYGAGSITREQFLFYEMRTTARLLNESMSDEEVQKKIVEENLFQYPTEKTIKRIAGACIQRLHAMNDPDLVDAIATQDLDTSKQVCLYAMMKQYRLFWDFMITVIGAKYRQQDYSFSRRDVNVFFLQLQEQDDLVASWSESTVKRIQMVFMKILVENEYIEDNRATRLQPVLISPVLENAIRSNGEELALPAFNCF